MATIDPAAYVRSITPFAELPPEEFEAAIASLDVAFHPAGAVLATPRGEPLRHLHVIRKGTVRLERNGRVLQVLEEGEIFGYTSLLAREATIEVVVEDDLVAYRLPASAFERLLGNARFAAHFAVRVTERLRASMAPSGLAVAGHDLAIEVQRIAPRAPVWVAADATVGEAARTMRRERISSLLVRGDPPGIVTDRDLRGRVLAEGLGPATPVGAVASRPLRTVAATTPVHAAWSSLLDGNIHHLPLTRGDRVVGIVTSTDFLRHTAPGPIAVLRGVERLPARGDLAGYAGRVAQMCGSLLASGLDALVIAGLVARLNDVLVHRILEWAEAELGRPPAPYAFIVLGSEGRMEQTLLTDQDDALVFADEGARDADWFRRLAERVNADLVAAGFPECPGGYMARAWHGPMSDWIARFTGWTDAPDPRALLAASIFFDFRRVAGRLDVEPLEAVLSAAQRKTSFLRLLAASSLRQHPPPRLLLRLRGESSVVDLKAQGISPIVLPARCFGLEAGTRGRSTAERLSAAVRAGLVPEEQRATLVEALRFLLGLRLRVQLEALARGAPMTSKVALADLRALERTRLKEAFRAIEGWHDHARQHYQTNAS
jgi:CBS domain-containing protein